MENIGTITTLDQIKFMAQTGMSGSKILTDSMLEEVMPTIIENINTQSKDTGYDGVTYNRPKGEYPPVFYNLLYSSVIRQTVLEYLNDKHPQAWFKPLYFEPNVLSALAKSK